MSTGFPEAYALLRRLSQPDLSDVLSEQNKRIIGVAQVYPPERAGQRYQRTYQLRDAWTAIPPSRSGDTWTAGARNETEYGEDVMGADQADVHQGRWRTVDAIAETEAPLVAAAVELAIHQIAGG